MCPVAKYSHCIVAKPIKVDGRSFTLTVLGTDNMIITSSHIQNQLLKMGITVISNGSDGAGPFLKAMLEEKILFSLSRHQNV